MYISDVTNKQVTMCNGASNLSEGERAQYDFYATDPRAVDLLLEVETFAPQIWECAAGAGHISEALKKYGYEVYSTDLIYRGYGIGGIDFFKIRSRGRLAGRYNNKPAIQIRRRICRTRVKHYKQRSQSRHVFKINIFRREKAKSIF